MNRQNERDIIRETRDLSPEEIESLTQSAVNDLEKLTTAQEIKDWWNQYYLRLGHKRLGRMLIGKSPDRFKYRRRNPSPTPSEELVKETPKSTPKPSRRSWRGPARVT